MADSVKMPFQQYSSLPAESMVCTINNILRSLHLAGFPALVCGTGIFLSLCVCDKGVPLGPRQRTCTVTGGCIMSSFTHCTNLRLRAHIFSDSSQATMA